MRNLLALIAVILFSFTSQAASERWRGFAVNEQPLLLLHQVQDGTTVKEAIYLPQSNGSILPVKIVDQIISFSGSVYMLENGLDFSLPSGSDLSSEPEIRNADSTSGQTLTEVKIAPELLARAQSVANKCEALFGW